MDRAMAAALDRYLTSEPEYPDILGVDYMLHCDNACGAFLPVKPDYVGFESRLYRCPGMPNNDGYDPECDRWDQPHHGPHWFWDHCVTLNFRWCRKCGHRNTEVVF